MMNPGPRISVVTPSYNQGQFLQATLDSVLSQEYPRLEYVVIDGGSRDGSADILRQYADRLSYWVSEPDGGLYRGLNKGFARTTGEVMAWINSSDLHYPWTLATVAEIFSQLPEVEWIMGLPSHFGVSGGPRSVVPRCFNVYDILAGDYKWIQQESVFWRRSLWEEAGGGLDESLRYAADFDLWLRFLRLAPLYHAGTVLGGWRMHDASLGDSGEGHYMQEVQAVTARFAAGADPRFRLRARLVQAAGLGRHSQVVARSLRRLGVWPWYTHPRVAFDFGSGTWAIK
jgi:glycosyltransferase involved in cell wall biosynthesis